LEVNFGIIYLPVMECKMISLQRLWRPLLGLVCVRWI